MHLDEHVACPYLWHAGVLEAENFGPSTLVGLYCLHRVQGADPRGEPKAARSSTWRGRMSVAVWTVVLMASSAVGLGATESV